LLDEPLSNLDRKLRQQLRAELRRIHREFRKTLIYVTHDQEEALSLSDRIVVMMGGQIEQIGTPRDIYDEPATVHVSEFMGECLSYRGTVVGTETDGSHVVEIADGMRWHVHASDVAVEPGDVVRLAIRSESLGPASSSGGDVNRFTAPIIDKYFSGEVTRLVCRAPGGCEIPVSVPPDSVEARLDIGAQLACAIEPAKVHCFPEQER